MIGTISATSLALRRQGRQFEFAFDATTSGRIPASAELIRYGGLAGRR
jgi:hypothetical protein